MKVEIQSDLLSGCAFFIISIIVILLIPSQIAVLGDSRITSRTFPYILSFLIMVMSLRLIISDVAKLIKRKKVKITVYDLKIEAKAVLLFGILLAYLIFMPLIGFLVSSILMCIGFLLYFRVKKSIYYIISIVSSILVFLVFRYGLNVLLP